MILSFFFFSFQHKQQCVKEKSYCQTTNLQPEKISDPLYETVKELPLEKVVIEEKHSEEEFVEEEEEETEEEKGRRRFRKAISCTQEEHYEQLSQQDTFDHKVPDPIDDLLQSDQNLDLYEFTQFTQTQSDVCKEGASQGKSDDRHNVNNMLSELMASQACWGTQQSEQDEDEDEESVVPQRPYSFPRKSDTMKNKRINCKFIFTFCLYFNIKTTVLFFFVFHVYYIINRT